MFSPLQRALGPHWGPEEANEDDDLQLHCAINAEIFDMAGPGCIHNVAIHNVAIHNVAGNILNFFLFILGDILNYGGDIMIFTFNIMNVHS